MNKISELINKPKINVIGLLIGMLISWIIGMSTDLPQSSGHGGFIPLVYPPIIALFFIGIFYISRIFSKKYNWIVSLFGIIYLLYFGIDFYLIENI
ncbi:hypothetical protein GZ212_15920 [Mangrovimonas sp. CR14]|uniref:hypothetical protein n=1 Tax=Mangrovimonas sp. CR14 TaxID=2706120 RepID=UPI00141DA5E6|nr:hypothetical protein [Mangrovimonas sp. CR14]NIK93648.1 hypothetical protein [Mangrovimonas sp. CR14]